MNGLKCHLILLLWTIFFPFQTAKRSFWPACLRVIIVSPSPLTRHSVHVFRICINFYVFMNTGEYYYFWLKLTECAFIHSSLACFTQFGRSDLVWSHPVWPVWSVLFGLTHFVLFDLLCAAWPSLAGCPNTVDSIWLGSRPGPVWLDLVCPVRLGSFV